MHAQQTLDGATWAYLSLEEKRAAWATLSEATRTAARDTFRRRCANGTLHPAISGVRRIKALTKVGDVEVLYPRVTFPHCPSCNLMK